MQYQVITKVPDWQEVEAMAGNVAMALPLYVDVALDGTVRMLDVHEGALNMRAPVFALGEVVIVEDDGREAVGHQRKASKWDVQYETFDTIDAAVARAQEVLDAG